MNLTMAHIMLIQMLTDIITQAAAAIANASTMSEEEVQAKIPEAEATSKELRERLAAH